MRKLYPLLERLSRSDVPVILEGETGTGKEVVAESIHEASARHKGPFIVFDCTAVPPSLMESALFGHEKGSFTGAGATRHGVFEQANGGTLLIDEIGDLEIGLQAKLLRAIQRSEVQRIGSNVWIKANVRILSATRRDLEREIQAGRFRDDLYYRLAVARVELPALRKRQGDIALLARHFWTELKGDPREFTPELVARLESYSWPGNIRELQNAVAHRIALGDLADLDSLRREDSSATLVESSPGGPFSGGEDVITRVIREELPFMRARSQVMGEFERRYCEWVLDKHNGNITRASAASGIARRYFYTIRARSGAGT
jgi:DNA-binding NtrC family response regulator